jgi:hypothetical protein
MSRCVASLLWAWLAMAAIPASAQPRQASLDRMAPRSGGSQVEFVYRASRPGDRAEHRHESGLELATRILQAGQTASERTESILRRQRYHVALLEPAAGESARAKVDYRSAREDRRKTATSEAESSEMAVAGQTYLACRIDGKLSIFDAQGHPAPSEQSLLVERTLRSLGQRNPLGHFLNGQSVASGQRLTLPVELSRELWDFGEELGAADHCELTLREVVDRPAGTCGRFDLVVRAAHDRGQLDLEGQVLVEAGTCRTLESDLRGTFRSQNRRGPAGLEFTIERSGTIHVTTRAEPADRQAAARLQ